MFMNDVPQALPDDEKKVDRLWLQACINHRYFVTFPLLKCRLGKRFTRNSQNLLESQEHHLRIPQNLFNIWWVFWWNYFLHLDVDRLEDICTSIFISPFQDLFAVKFSMNPITLYILDDDMLKSKEFFLLPQKCNFAKENFIKAASKNRKSPPQ